MEKCTATSYAVLGLLARHPWSAYELNVYLRTSAIAFIWPRAASRLYQEPKNLVSNALATVRNETLNGRNRSVYSITHKGQQALQQWLKQNKTHFVIESESMLKIAHADAGDIETLRNQISAIKNATLQDMQTTIATLQDQIDKEDYSPGSEFNLELQLLQLSSKIQETRLLWSQQAEKTVAHWHSPAGSPNDQKSAKSKLSEIKSHLESIVEEHSN